MKEMLFDPVLLEDFCVKLFEKVAVPEKDARIISRALVVTDMRGIHSHGVVRIARYMDCVLCGGIKPAAEPIVEEESASHLRISANGGLGIAASYKATEMLIRKAQESAISIATVTHSDHFGAAGLYSLMMAEAGLIGYSMGNTCPLMAVTGGTSKIIGNNPFSCSCPAGKYRAVLFDICMSVAANGKLILAAEEGKSIPDGYLLTKDGKPTNDPSEIYKGGIMLPVGDHKGYGFAVMVEMMTSLLGGDGLLSSIHSWNTVPGRDAGSAHCFMAINPKYFGGLEPFVARTEKMIDELKSSNLAPGVDKIRYPGEKEFDKEALAAEKGLLLPVASLHELARAAKIAGLEKELELLGK